METGDSGFYSAKIKRLEMSELRRPTNMIENDSVNVNVLLKNPRKLMANNCQKKTQC